MSEMVSIPASRFEELLGAETRLDVLEDYLMNNKYTTIEDICIILGMASKLIKVESEENKNG